MNQPERAARACKYQAVKVIISPLQDTDARYMAMALDLARQGKAFAGPNPAVGAVIVKKGRVVGTGYYMGPGTLHAEAEAIRVAGEHAAGATMFVTLEPHCYYGTQPPCTDKIIAAGISRVVIATVDPNPKVNGKGIAQLREAGIQVELGLMEAEARALNRGFFKRHEQGLPFVRLKLGLSLDGFISDESGRSQWITGPEARRFVHGLRGEVTGVAVGVGTVLADDPLLTPREVYAPRPPVRFVLDPHLRTPLSARVLSADAPTVIIAGPEAESDKVKALEKVGASVWVMSEGYTWARVFERMVQEDQNDILFEGGARVARSLMESPYLDELILIYAPLRLGKGLSPFPGEGYQLEIAKRFQLQEVEQLGQDAMLRLVAKKGESDGDA